MSRKIKLSLPLSLLLPPYFLGFLPLSLPPSILPHSSCLQNGEAGSSPSRPVSPAIAFAPSQVWHSPNTPEGPTLVGWQQLCMGLRRPFWDCSHCKAGLLPFSNQLFLGLGNVRPPWDLLCSSLVMSRGQDLQLGAFSLPDHLQNTRVCSRGWSNFKSEFPSVDVREHLRTHYSFYKGGKWGQFLQNGEIG